jgi:SAM-dependent methyltransferase
MLDAAGLAPGMIVLDLACGPGGLAEQVATRVRPGGRVIATDLSPGMVEVTRRRARRRAIEDLEAREMDAQDLAFENASFGAVTCRFGLMLCPDPVRAATEARRVLRPGGRFVLAVWDVPERNPMFATMSDVVGRYVPTPPPDPSEPGPFRLAPPGELERVLRAGGFSDVMVEPFPMPWRYGSPEEFCRVQLDMSSAMRTAAATLDPLAMERLRADLAAAVGPFLVDGDVRFDMTPLIARAVR